MNYSVNVSNADLKDALRQLSRILSKKEPAEAVLVMEDGELLFELPGGPVGVDAVGEWSGRVRIQSHVVQRLGDNLPESDPLNIFVREDRLYFGDNFSVGCVLSGVDAYSIELPIDPPIWMILGLRMQHPEDAIERAGLKRRVTEAEERAARLIARAAETLAPLGVEMDDVRRVVEAAFRRKIG